MSSIIDKFKGFDKLTSAAGIALTSMQGREQKELL
jgi:hypothetical protein